MTAMEQCTDTKRLWEINSGNIQTLAAALPCEWRLLIRPLQAERH